MPSRCVIGLQGFFPDGNSGTSGFRTVIHILFQLYTIEEDIRKFTVHAIRNHGLFINRVRGHILNTLGQPIALIRCTINIGIGILKNGQGKRSLTVRKLIITVLHPNRKGKASCFCRHAVDLAVWTDHHASRQFTVNQFIAGLIPAILIAVLNHCAIGNIFNRFRNLLCGNAGVTDGTG